jgi:hypothetical protein
LRSSHGVRTGGAACAASAATSRRAMSLLSATLTASRTVPGTLRPASIASTALAWASSTSSRVARPALRRTTRPVPEWGAGR